MPTDLLQTGWSDLDSGELRFILLERIGKPGQYDGRDSNPNSFYLPLAGSSCRIKLTFSDSKQILAIEPGPAFDAAQWKQVVEEIERTGPHKVGRDCSFSSFRVAGSWRGKRSGVQILPPPADAPRAPCEMAEHPFILEYPMKVSDLWPITNFRRMREHRQLTFLLNVLLAGSTTIQPRRPRHLWAIVPEEWVTGQEVKWVQEFYFTNFGEALRDELSPQAAETLEEVDPETYYARVGHDLGGLRVPADLDDSICCFMRLSKANRDKFSRAGFWRDMARRQWTVSFSASFASLAIAVESLAEPGRDNRGAKFRTFIERYAPGRSLENRRKEMYALRSDILHGSGLMEMDQDTDFGWAPPEQKEKDLMDELWGLTRIAMRNWLKNPPPP
ncbi:MAG TPA: hypothetical protein DDY78_05435 [Planctomycetales bacterium]|jgi:hypothetical protein|nr:hypothetical protein [Planctomycetales bacterium]